MFDIGLDPIGLFAVAGVGLAMVILPRVRDAGERARQLRSAADLLRRHNAAVDIFTGDDTAPAELRHLLLDLSEALEDDQLVCDLAKRVLVREPVKSAEQGPIEALRAMAKADPEKLEIFHDALIAGMLSAFLRVAETAGEFDQLLVNMMEPARRNAIFASARRTTDKWNMPVFGPSPLAA